MAESKRIAVILAGGSGTRFWPLSRENRPKQYLRLFGERSLIQHTYDRAARLCAKEDIYVCTAESQIRVVQEQLPGIQLIVEPEACNTSPAVLLSALSLMRKGYSGASVMMVFPADHYITDPMAFDRILKDATTVATETDGLVTLGIVPNFPHTGYGYIEAGEKFGPVASKVERFVEKPDAKTAEGFLQSGKFFWNGGIFVWRLEAIRQAFEHFVPVDLRALQAAGTTTEVREIYRSITRAPVDKAILEKAQNVYVVPAQMGWSDVGSWNALHELKSLDRESNAVEADRTYLAGTFGCLIHAPDKKVAAIGIENTIIVADGDSLLVCARDQDQRVRDAAKALS